MIIIPDDDVPGLPSLAAPPKKPQETAGVGETAAAAGTLMNWPYRSWRYLQNRDEAVNDPDYEPLADIAGTKYETNPERFAHSRSAEETQAIKREWDEDEDASGVLARSGRFGTVAMIGAGLADPTVLLPVAKVFTGAAQGYRALRIGADVAATSAAGAAIGEAAMAVTTPNYGADDIAIGIGSATILGGFLGTGAGALMTRGERKAMTQALDADRKAWAAEVETNYQLPAPAPASAGAAAAESRTLELDMSPALMRVDPTAKISPPRRVLAGPFVSARRAVADLVETPYLFKENRLGVATTQGPALDRQARLETNKARFGLLTTLDRTYTQYRFGAPSDTWRESMSRTGTRALDVARRPDGSKATFAEFKEMIDGALRNGDAHDVPEVTEAARWMRANVLAPWRDRAIAAKLLPEGVDAATADSYMIRVWNKQRLIGERPQARAVFADWLQGEEAKKLVIQDEVRGLTGQIETLQANIAKRSSAADYRDAKAVTMMEQQIAALRSRLEDAVNRWDGKSSKAAKAALGARAANAGGQAADNAVDLAAQRIMERSLLTTRGEIDSLADEIIDRIVGSPDGRLPYDAYRGRDDMPGRAASARGPLSAREFMIPDALVRDFIEKDVASTAEIYLNTMVPDVLLTERFGDVDMTESFRALNEEASAMMHSATTAKARDKIEAQRVRANADIAAMRDRIRHTYGWSSDPRQRFLGRMARTAGQYDILTNLGGAALSSIADIAGIQWRYGLTSTFRHAWRPFFKMLTNPETRRAVLAQKDQLRALGLAAETWLATRASSLHDVADTYRPTTRLERGIKVASDKFQKVSLLAHWTDFGKLAAGMVSSTEISKAVDALTAGKATVRQTRNLAEGGIDAAMAARVDAALKAEGGSDVIDGMRIPNSGNWTDAGARDAFEGALARDVDMMIITPGAEKPLMMSRPIAALILQYKSFVTAANERILVRSLMTRDRQVLEGLVSAVGLGILAEYAYSGIVGRDAPTRPGDLIKAGVTRSGMLGWYQEANALSEKWFDADAFSAIGAKRPDTRYISRETLTAALGPTAGKIEALIKTGRNVAELDWSATDTRRMRRMLAGQNLFYIRALLDRVEAAGNEAAGVEPLE